MTKIDIINKTDLSVVTVINIIQELVTNPKCRYYESSLTHEDQYKSMVCSIDDSLKVAVISCYNDVTETYSFTLDTVISDE